MRRRRPVRAVASFLVEWELSIDVTVYRIAAVRSIERLCVVRSEAEVMDILREPVDVVVLVRMYQLY
jgi:hypothetical protein